MSASLARFRRSISPDTTAGWYMRRERAQGAGAHRCAVEPGEGDVRHAEHDERVDGEVRDPLVGARREREEPARLVTCGHAHEAADGLYLDLRIGVGERLDEQLRADALQLIGAVGQRADSVSRTRGSAAGVALARNGLAFAPWSCFSVKIAAASRIRAQRLITDGALERGDDGRLLAAAQQLLLGVDAMHVVGRQ